MNFLTRTTYMTKIVCISDTHGYLPTDLPEGDILIHAGDICPLSNHSVSFQKSWLETNFRDWLYETKKKFDSIVYIAGNHDHVFQAYDLTAPSWINYEHRQIWEGKGIYYLQDNGIKIGNLKIWGTPWQKRFFDWSFNLDEPELALKWELIPDDTDIVVCHGPAYMYGDLVPGRPNYRDDTVWPKAEHVGSPSMLAKLEKIQAKLYVCGHVHEGRGVYQHGPTTIVNASYLDASYKPYKKDIAVIEL